MNNDAFLSKEQVERNEKEVSLTKDKTEEKTVVLYGQSNKDDVWFLESFPNCPEVNILGLVINFVDKNGYRHETSRPWEVITKKLV